MCPVQWSAPAVGERFEERERIRHHQVDVDEGVGAPRRTAGADRRPHREIRREVTVHHVDVKRVRTRLERRWQSEASLAKSAERIDARDQRAVEPGA